MHNIPAQRKGESISLLSPPYSQVLANLEPFVPVSQLPFMNDQPHLGLAGPDGSKNLVERYHDKIDLRGWHSQPKLQGKERAGHSARDGNAFSGNFRLREFLEGHQHG